MYCIKKINLFLHNLSGICINSICLLSNLKEALTHIVCLLQCYNSINNHCKAIYMYVCGRQNTELLRSLQKDEIYVVSFFKPTIQQLGIIICLLLMVIRYNKVFTGLSVVGLRSELSYKLDSHFRPAVSSHTIIF